MGNPEKQIHLIRCEQENRVLSNDMTKNLGDACRLRGQKITPLAGGTRPVSAHLVITQPG